MRVLWMAFLLPSCAAAPPAPVVANVLASVPCVGAVPARPVLEFNQLSTTASDGEKIRALARG